MSIASLPMYDLPEPTAANDAFWRAIARALEREGLAGVPQALTRGVDLGEIWRDPDFLFGQTCGYPLMNAFKGEMRVIATPVYDAPGCEGSDYCSHIVVRADDPARDLSDLRGRTAAVTPPASQSGSSAPRPAVAPGAGPA